MGLKTVTVTSFARILSCLREGKSDDAVNPEDVPRYIDSDEGSLPREELIALHVLGSTLLSSVSQDNINTNIINLI